MSVYVRYVSLFPSMFVYISLCPSMFFDVPLCISLLLLLLSSIVCMQACSHGITLTPISVKQMAQVPSRLVPRHVCVSCSGVGVHVGRCFAPRSGRNLQGHLSAVCKRVALSKARLRKVRFSGDFLGVFDFLRSAFSLGIPQENL